MGTARNAFKIFAVVILMMATLSTPAAASAGRPEDFVRRVYAHYQNGGPGIPMERPGGSAFYSAGLLDAFKKDTASPTGGRVTAEWDPICDCHAFLNLRLTSLTIAEAWAKRVRARVTFVSLKYPHTVTLTLSRTPRGWRIADIGVKDASYQDVGIRNVGSIIALLRNANAHPVQPVVRKRRRSLWRNGLAPTIRERGTHMIQVRPLSLS